MESIVFDNIASYLIRLKHILSIWVWASKITFSENVQFELIQLVSSFLLRRKNKRHVLELPEKFTEIRDMNCVGTKTVEEFSKHTYNLCMKTK